MPHVVTENCIKCKYTNCASLCPVSAFHEAEEYLVINPVECVDCGLCVHACGAHAIYPQTELPPDQLEFVEINRKFSAHLPVIYATRTPLPSAAQWNGVPGKKQYLPAAEFAG